MPSEYTFIHSFTYLTASTQYPKHAPVHAHCLAHFQTPAHVDAGMSVLAGTYTHGLTHQQTCAVQIRTGSEALTRTHTYALMRTRTQRQATAITNIRAYVQALAHMNAFRRTRVRSRHTHAQAQGCAHKVPHAHAGKTSRTHAHSKALASIHRCACAHTHATAHCHSQTCTRRHACAHKDTCTPACRGERMHAQTHRVTHGHIRARKRVR